jgi:glutamyl-tRNA synthetase
MIPSCLRDSTSLRSQGRITNILDIPKLAPYFFIEPDYGSREAESMIKSISQVDIGTV